MDFSDYWNKTHRRKFSGKIMYDNWLDKYESILSNCKTKILDLGAGTGNNTLYLTRKGFKVISTDYSEVALEIIENNISNAEVQFVDISQTLPFGNDTFDVIVADLCLHYFDNETTKKIMNEIKRVLTPKGYLFARVNSVDDKNHGAGQGEKLEDNYYFVEGYNKRFFSIEDAKNYFSIIGDVNAFESSMMRYSKPKEVIEISVKKI